MFHIDYLDLNRLKSLVSITCFLLTIWISIGSKSLVLKHVFIDYLDLNRLKSLVPKPVFYLLSGSRQAQRVQCQNMFLIDWISIGSKVWCQNMFLIDYRDLNKFKSLETKTCFLLTIWISIGLRVQCQNMFHIDYLNLNRLKHLVPKYVSY